MKHAGRFVVTALMRFECYLPRQNPMNRVTTGCLSVNPRDFSSPARNWSIVHGMLEFRVGSHGPQPVGF
jgi:hypothetical protein